MSEGGKSERAVNVTVNNNTSSGAKSNGTIASTSSLISINDGSGYSSVTDRTRTSRGYSSDTIKLRVFSR